MLGDFCGVLWDLLPRPHTALGYLVEEVPCSQLLYQPTSCNLSSIYSIWRGNQCLFPQVPVLARTKFSP